MTECDFYTHHKAKTIKSVHNVCEKNKGIERKSQKQKHKKIVKPLSKDPRKLRQGKCEFDHCFLWLQVYRN